MVLRPRRPSSLSLKLFGLGGGGRKKWRWKNEGGWVAEFWKGKEGKSVLAL